MSSIDKGKSVPSTLVHIHLPIASSVQSKLNDRVFRRAAAAAAVSAATPLSFGACAATKSYTPPPPPARASASRPRPAAPLLLQQLLTLPRPEAARRRHRGWTSGVSNREVQQPPAASLRPRAGWPRDLQLELQLRAERPRWRPARRRGTARALSPPRGRRKAERMKAAFPRAAIGTEDTAAPLACASWGSVSFSFRDLSIVNISRSSR